MHRYAAGFAAGAIFLALTETAVFMRAINRALTEDDSTTDDTDVAQYLSGQPTHQEA